MPSKLNPDPVPAADARGQRVVRREAFDVFVDIGSEEDYQFLLARLDDITKHNHNIDLRILSAEPSKSGLPHRHVYLKASRPLGQFEAVALQACLSSDRVREFLSMMRTYAGGEGTTFFEAPDWKDPR